MNMIEGGTMKGQWTRVVGAIAWLLIAGCQTPGALGSGALSASDSNSGDSGSGDSSDSNSGNSSDSNSGNSSDSDSGNSSDSSSGESKSGQSNPGQSASSEASGESAQDSGQWSLNASKTSEGTTNTTAESSRASSANSSESSDSRSSRSSTGPVLSVSIIGATVGGLGMVIWQALKVVPAAPTPADVGQAAQVYLRAHTHQLREDLALGAGPTIEDLAAMARIRRENLRTFGRLLREHRSELLTLAGAAALTPERALSWLERVGQLSRTEPRLEEDRRAFLAAHGIVE